MHSFRDLPLCAGLDARELAALEASAERRAVARGARLTEEGQPSTHLYVLVSGRAEALKRTQAVDRALAVEHAIGEVLPGEVVGEVGFFDRLPRSATVRAVEPCVVWALPYAAVERSAALRDRLAQRLAARLRATGVASLESAQHRAVLGELIVKVVILLCAYAMLLAAMPHVRTLPSSSSYISLPLVAVFGWGSWRFVRNTGYPLAHFGLGARALIPSLLESAALTPVFCAALVAVKWAVMRAHPAWRALPLFEHPAWRARLAEPLVLKLLAIYLVSSAVQELIVRSALQASLESFLVGPRRRAAAIFSAALLFSVNHLHMSVLFALLTFLPGVFWGWLFSRRRNLVGPTLSHFVVGAFVFFVLGISLP